MFNTIKAKAKSVGTGIATGALFIAASMSTALAQTAAPTTPVELIQTHSSTFMDDTKAVLFAGAGLLIGAYLIKALVNLAINFFRRG